MVHTLNLTKENILAKDNQRTDDMEKALKEYFKKGGKVTVCEPGARTEDLQVGQWGRRKAKKKAD